MPITNFPNGISSFGVPIIGAGPIVTSGSIFFVDSVTGSNGNTGSDTTHPFATIDYAIGRCTANKGDHIIVMPNHVEDITAASGIDFDVAGITVIGLGNGTNRPRIDWEAADATMEIAVANIRLVNLHMVASFASVAEMIDVAAVEGFEMHNCLIEDESSALEFLEAISFATAATGIKLIGNTILGRSVDNNAAIQFEGTADDLVIENNTIIYGAVQSATVALIDSAGALTNASIKFNTLVSQSATITGALIDTSADAGNNGMLAYNLGGVLDTTATNAEQPWDVTGMAMVENLVCDTVDTQGWHVPVIGATG